MNELLTVKNLKVKYDLHQSWFKELFSKEKSYVKAVDGVDFTIHKGEILTLVGESGSGKTTTGKAILQLLDNVEGDIEFNGTSLPTKEKKVLKGFRQDAQMIYQDPYQSLNPKDRVFDIVAEPLVVNKMARSEQEKEEKVKTALESSGLKPAEKYLAKYPHELSGGQRQRVAIAAALILNPKLIIADEPVSMLDMSVRSDILRVLIQLRDHKDISYLFITHDLSLAWLISDRIAIMYLGKIVEVGSYDKIMNASLHPYTKALINVMPRLEVKKKREKRLTLTGETPDPSNVPSGCRFHPRCPFAQEKCKQSEPSIRDFGDGHHVACHFVEELKEEVS
ncbi:ABC transporter ATP-binding protein [Falsibacillus albus]|uniref:ABC transporter ATP-binding protein n=1 Tax=Falsibacillus albus TaxID=2478915 RepID=A0A3L7JVL2_9BACI|nr:ABC transporter ATP-binding protein [Falsibacillus albus]RLQ94786.1 ABC transporter ATP-binding protein [Falsibacillus albus]